jgi:crotonobetainyl-CoA:carnitine CoA-transferase CaiB-like acyl-CoA transferase
VPYTDAKIIKLFELMGDADFLANEPFNTPMGRFQNMTPIYGRIGELSPQKTTAEWLEILTANDFPVMPVADLGDVIHNEHLVATGFFQMAEHPTEGTIRQMSPPVRYSADKDRPIGFAPTLGQHTDEIKREVQG